MSGANFEGTCINPDNFNIFQCLINPKDDAIE